MQKKCEGRKTTITFCFYEEGKLVDDISTTGTSTSFLNKFPSLLI